MSFEQSFRHVLKWEGGWTNDPRDPGGATNLGIIQSEYNAYRKRNGRALQSVRFISMAEAEDIYKHEYWDVMHCDDLNPGVANAVFDSGVNSGNARGVTWLQRAICGLSGAGAVAVVGIAGPLTTAAANNLPPDKIIDGLLDLRLAFDHACHNPRTGAALWPVFGAGWSDRVHGVRAESHLLAKTEVSA